MFDTYHSSLVDYIRQDRLPLGVEPCRRHPHRLFHDHDYTELVMITEGEAVHLVGGYEAAVKPGDVLVIQPGHLHAYDHFTELKLVNILYDREKLSLPLLDSHALPLFEVFFPTRKADDPAVMARPVMHLNPDDLSMIITLTERLEKEIKGILPGNLYFSLSVFMEITATLARLSDYEASGRKTRFQIGEAIGFINRHYAEKIVIDDLAQTARMSVRNFFRQFKLCVGRSPVDYLLELRLDKARAILVNSDASVNEVAQECGFYDSNYFCRVFRRAMGVSPRQYRLRHR